MKYDFYRSIPRVWVDQMVYTGLVEVQGIGQCSYYEVREAGQTLRTVAELDRSTLRFAYVVAQRNGLIGQQMTLAESAAADYAYNQLTR